MFKVINRKMYNTEKASDLIEISLYDIKTNTDTYKEVLYKTKKGDYFLYTYVDNIVSDNGKIGEDLILLNIIDVIDWYQKRQVDFSDENREKFFKEFGKYIMEG